jgi:DNA modification methylase
MTSFPLKTDNSTKKIDIAFRNEMASQFPSTTYGTFGLYKYPAKFIPHIIGYVIKEYAKKEYKILDPFGGYGTVGTVARIYGNDYELWDLNPLIEVIHNTIIKKSTFGIAETLLIDLKNSNKNFIPNWDNLNYWFKEEFLEIISKSWGFVHDLDENVKHIFQIPLIKVSRFFSNSDEDVHKLYSSKKSKLKIDNLLMENWQDIFYKKLEREVLVLQKKLYESQLLNPKNVNFVIKGGVDILSTNLNGEVDLVITSPPYLQAQEYIRSTKLELYWLGYNENLIKKLGKTEIPYRDVNPIEIRSEIYNFYKDLIEEDHLLRLYNNYFFSIISAFENISLKVRKYMFIFVGPAKIREMKIPIDEILVEHFQNSGWYHEKTYNDKIVSRSMFKSKFNPASGLVDERMESEQLIVLKR